MPVLYSTTMPPSPHPALLTDLFAGLPQGVIIYQAVRDADGTILDYQTLYYNQQALAITGHTADELTNQLLFQRAPYTRTQAEKMRQVVYEQIPFDTQEYNPLSNRWFAYENRPLGDGFFTLIRDIDDLKQTEQRVEMQHEALRQQAAHTAAQQLLVERVLNTSPGSVLVFDARPNQTGSSMDFRVVFANDAALRIIGHPLNEVIGISLKELYPQTELDGLGQQYLDVYQTGKSFRAERYYPVVEKWFDVSISKIETGLVAIYNDITPAKTATLKLNEQVSLFDGVLNSISNGLSVLEAIRDKEGQLADLKYIQVSRTLITDTGLTEAQLLDSTMLKLFPHIKATAYWPAYQAALQTGIQQEFEEHYVGDGIDNYTSNYITRLDKNRLLSVYVIINDRKKTELKIQNQANILQSVLDSCQLPIVLFEAIRDAKGQIIDFRYIVQNQPNARLVNFPIAESYTKTMLEISPNLKPLGIFDRYVQVVETGKPARFEQRLTDDPVDSWFEFSVVKQGDGIVSSASDQTLLRQTLQRAEQLVLDLQQSNASLEQFAYVASHDLQEPLRKIQSFGNLLTANYADALPLEAKDMLQRMQSGASRMSTMIRDLLTYSQLSMQQEPNKSVDLNELLSGIIGDFDLTISEKNAQIIIGDKSNPVLPIISGNPVQLRQLFYNLVSNALKFSRPGVPPQVHIIAVPVLAATVPEVIRATSSNWLALTVQDNGIGFDEQYRARIFQLFERLNTRQAYSGTGIGLAVCLKVAEKHRGTIVAEGRPGEGATFKVFLPKSETVTE